MKQKLHNILTAGATRALALLALAVTVVASVHAAEYTVFDSSNAVTWEENSETNGFIQKGELFTIVTDKAESTNPLLSPAETSNVIRVYKSSSVTISSETVTMKQIVITALKSHHNSVTYTEGWDGSGDASDTFTYTVTSSGSKSFTLYATGGQVRITKIVVTGDASTALGEIECNNESVVNGQTYNALKGDVFKFSAVNATSMTLNDGSANELTGANSVEWTAPEVAEKTEYTLKVTATDGTNTKNVSVVVSVAPAPLCGQIVFDPASGEIVKDSYVTMTCDNAVQIKYWLDDEAEAVVMDATDAKVKISNDCTLHAVGINADGIEGAESEASYTVKQATLAGFDFTNKEVIESAYSGSDLAAEGSNTDNNNLDGKTLELNEVTLVFEKGTNNASPRWWQNTANQGGKTELRFYNQNTMTITAPANAVLTNVTFTLRQNTLNVTCDAGEINDNIWTPANDNTKSVVFTGTKTSNIYSIEVGYNVKSGIAGIEAEAGEAVYYNLQGVRVENPVKGLYIRVANGKSQKVMM